VRPGIAISHLQTRETREWTAIVPLTKEDAVNAIRGVPAQVCGTCGEEYVDQETAAHLSAIMDSAARDGVQLDARRYVAA